MTNSKWIKIGLSLLLVAVLSSISLTFLHGDDFPAQQRPVNGARARIVIVGNSITFHGPKPSVGWNGEQGMAATSIDRDYAHLLIKHLSIDPDEAYIRNFYPFETSDKGAKENIKSVSDVWSHRPSITVIELGDNVKAYKLLDLLNFYRNYRSLASVAAVSSEHLYCLSTFWQSTVVDWVIRSSCEKSGGTFVDIGDIYKSPRNPDRSYLSAHPVLSARVLDAKVSPS